MARSCRIESSHRRRATARTETALATSPERCPPIPSATMYNPNSGRVSSPAAFPCRTNSESSLCVRSMPVDCAMPTTIRPCKGVIIACPTVVGSSGAVLTPSGVGAGFFLPKMRLNRSMSVLERALGRQVSKA